MRIRDIAAICMAFPCLALASETPTSIDATVDTFGKLLAKQVQMIESEMNAKIRTNDNQGISKNNAVPQIPAGVTPLIEAKQEIKAHEPIVEAIWGLAGKEVAEVSFRGQRIAVSMREPYISRIDGWKLESINQFEITLIKTDGIKISQRKNISLNWELTPKGQASAINSFNH